MNTKHKRASTKKSKGKTNGEGCALGAGSPLQAMRDALDDCAERELILTLQALDLKARLRDALDCCSAFFQVAGKQATDSWRQFEKAALMYQAILERENGKK